jgi:hypothetical protein
MAQAKVDRIMAVVVAETQTVHMAVEEAIDVLERVVEAINEQIEALKDEVSDE